MNPIPITASHRAAPVADWVSKGLHAMDEAVKNAINDAKAQGIPQGLIVAILHAHATSQTMEIAP